NLDPDIIYGVSGNSFVKLQVSTGRQTTIHKFNEYTKLDLGGGEGNISNDDRYAPLMGNHAGGVDVVIYDIKNNRVASSRRFDGMTGPYGDVDFAAMSPSGKYVIVGA